MSWSSSQCMGRYNRQSSANNLQRVPGDTWSVMSLIYTRNTRGPSTVPCGRPDNTLMGSADSSPSTTTVIVLPDRKLLTQSFRIPLTPYEASFPRSRSCGTVSNAREKSRMAMSVWTPGQRSRWGHRRWGGAASHKSGVAETHVVVRWGGYGPLGAAVYDCTHSAPVTCSTPQ